MLKIYAPFLIILLSLFADFSSANSIGLISPSTDTRIHQIWESDIIKGNDLYVNLSFEVPVSPNSFIINDSIKINFDPKYHFSHKEVMINNITVCKGASTGLSYDKPSISCVERIPTEYRIVRNYNYSNLYEYYIESAINPPKEVYDNYVVNIDYIIPNFVFEEGTNYVAWFTSNCWPSPDTCNPDRWIKIITLPSDKSVLVDLSGNIEIIGKVRGRWELEMSSERSSIVRFYDSTEVNVLAPLIWSFIGALLGAYFSRYFNKKFQISEVSVAKNNLIDQLKMAEFRKHQQKMFLSLLSSLSQLFVGLGIIGFTYLAYIHGKPVADALNAMIFYTVLTLFLLLPLVVFLLLKIVDINKGLENYYLGLPKQKGQNKNR